MKALTKIALGAAAVLGTLAIYSKSVGDEAKQNDFVLIPLKDLPSTDPFFAAAKAEAVENRASDASIIFRVTIDSPLTGMALGAVSPAGGTLAMDNEGDGPFAIDRSKVVGILKRGVPLAAEGGANQLEKGRFA